MLIRCYFLHLYSSVIKFKLIQLKKIAKLKAESALGSETV